MEEQDDCPYRAEYAKSNRSKCKGCKLGIEKDHLRLAVMIQSPLFDGKQPNWYHMSCFFAKQRPKAITDIAHFESIRWEDQEKIKSTLESVLGTAVPKTVKKNASNKKLNKDFNVEYAKSGRAVCCGCQEKIVKDDIRVGKMDYESEEAHRFGGINRWYHLECFVKLREELGFLGLASSLCGFLTLKADDKIKVEKELPALTETKDINTDETDGPSSSKKLKKSNDKELKIKRQNKLMFKYRDNLKTLNMNVLKELLDYNKQEIPTSDLGAVLDRLSDMMAFGTLLPCEECQGQFVFKSSIGYQCLGYKNEWLKCEKVLTDPPRKNFEIPSHLIENKAFNKYQCKIQKRLFVESDKTVLKPSSSVTNEKNMKKVTRILPLKNMEFTTLVKGEELKDLKLKLPRYGGVLISQCTPSVAAVFASQDSIEKRSAKMIHAKQFCIEVIEPATFLDAIEKGGNAIELIVEKNIAPWARNAKQRIEKRYNELEKEHTNKSNLKSKIYGKSMYEKSVPTSVKLTVKGGVAVEPQSGLEHKAHVHKDTQTWNANLCLSDVQTGKNSYYKIQLLKADNNDSYCWIFRSWGRIGTTIGGFKTQEYDSLSQAKSDFKMYYEEQTGNPWGRSKDEFVKMPGKKVPIDVDYGQNKEETLNTTSNIPCKLSDPLQGLIRLIFDVESMRKVLYEFELDLQKMPLGKLSRKQLQHAYATLKELSNIMDSSEEKRKKEKCIEVTNKFYSLIPHDFGIKTPQLIDSKEILNTKLEMIGSLMEIAIAYNMIDDVTSEDSTLNPLDMHYLKLKCDIDRLESNLNEYSIIEQYLKNTHAETHNTFSLSIKNVFKVIRNGEEKRFKPFKKLHNRKLLWHGSRITNYAAILSQGLRIAPKEAPVTGYMFGKGIYFADMVSKSANYCMASISDNTGLLLLCEVALGNIYERKRAEYIEKLPSGKHSCMGIGRTQPDPAGSLTLKDKVEVPFGKPVSSNTSDTTLLYNEYIVYDISQVKIRYLVQVDFKYDY